MMKLLMVQKSCTTSDGAKTRRKKWDKLPTSTGEFTGFLNHQQKDADVFYSKQKNGGNLEIFPSMNPEIENFIPLGVF